MVALGAYESHRLLTTRRVGPPVGGWAKASLASRKVKGLLYSRTLSGFCFAAQALRASATKALPAMPAFGMAGMAELRLH